MCAPTKGSDYSISARWRRIAGPTKSERQMMTNRDEKTMAKGFIVVVAITGAAQFMAGLDNLVATTALPVICERLYTGLAGLE